MTYKKKSKTTFTIFDMKMCHKCQIGFHNKCNGCRGGNAEGLPLKQCECRECNQ